MRKLIIDPDLDDRNKEGFHCNPPVEDVSVKKHSTGQGCKQDDILPSKSTKSVMTTERKADWEDEFQRTFNTYLMDKRLLKYEITSLKCFIAGVKRQAQLDMMENLEEVIDTIEKEIKEEEQLGWLIAVSAVRTIKSKLAVLKNEL